VADLAGIVEGGITNRNYRVRLGEGVYVLRLPGKDTSLLGISREAERVANQTAARLGIAPAVRAAEDHTILTEFMLCEPLDPDRLRAEPGQVAAALRAFHDSGVQLPARFWVPELLEQYAATVAERGGSPRERACPGRIRIAARRLAGRRHRTRTPARAAARTARERK